MAGYKAGESEPDDTFSSERQPGAHYPSRARADEQLALARAIESEIIPRLMLTCKTSLSALNGPSVPLGKDDIVTLTALTLAPNDDVLTYIDTLYERGVSLETVYLDLLTPVARQLGETWLDDDCNFAQVTLGLLRLQRVLHALSPAFRHNRLARMRGRRALLAAVDDEQHTFGLNMVGEFLRRDGWDVSISTGSVNELGAQVKRQYVDIVGLSISCDNRLPMLADAIATVRKASLNGDVAVLVGGPTANTDPQQIVRFGADATAVDAREAVAAAARLVNNARHPRRHYN